jgi:16S rRNA (uracil1498-N3)-methyltransferase
MPAGGKMPRTHASLPRLFVEPDLARGMVLALDRGQSSYLGTVLRRRAGDEVVVFNGRDGVWLARVAEAGKKAVTLALIEQTAPQPAAPDLWYGFAPLKAGRLDYMVQKATEMGAGIIQPVVTRFTQVSRLRPDKLRANIIEAAEQCEVLAVPALWPETPLADVIEGWAAAHGDRALVFADEVAASASPLESLRALAGRPVGLLVGPEGGFAEDERNLLRAKSFVTPISLGPRILRADTAAVAALAVVQASIGDWR